MTTAISELPPGYFEDPWYQTDAWCSLPYPLEADEKQAVRRHSLGDQVMDWAEGRVEDNPDGPGLIHHLTGEPWRFSAGQARFMILWYSYDPDTGRWLYRSGLKRGAKGPIAHATPVMTPSGWVKHGDLRAGDRVFAADGAVTTVLAVHPEVTEPCYEVEFRDGERIVCTGSHRWTVDEFIGGRSRRRAVATVAEMLAAGVTYERALTSGRTKASRGGVARWRALATPPVQGAPAEFPVPPYLLGYWLGDGDSDCPRITAHHDDLPSLFEQMDALGVEHGDPSWTHGDTYRVRFGRGWARKALRAAGLLGNKHIPPRLLRSSPTQRWALLQGIVDSDGTVGSTGMVEVSVKSGRLADDIFELVVTLGLMPTRTDGPARLHGENYGQRARIRFAPQPGEIVSQLPRKANRTIRPRAHRLPFSRSRTIVAIRPVDPVPARCITVEHPSHQYLVGERNVPTCNTGKDPFCAAWLNGELIGPTHLVRRNGLWVGERHRMPLVQVAANSEAQAKDVLRVANAQLPKRTREYFGADCGETRTIVADGGRHEILTSSEKSSEGDPATAIGLNESHHMTASNGGHRTAEVARRNVGKSPRELQARLCEFTNAHTPGSDSVAERTFEAWQAQVGGKTRRVDILYDSIEAPPHLDIYTDDGLRRFLRAAYADAPWSDLDRLAGEVLDPRTSAADSIRYYGNGLASREDAWVDPRRFDDLSRPDLVVHDGENIAMFLDCSKSTDATGMIGCRLDDGHVFTLGMWQRPRGDRGKGWLAPRHEVDAAVRSAFDRYRVTWFGVDPSPARDDSDESLYWMNLVHQWHRDFRDTVLVWATPGAQTGNAVLFDMRTSQYGGKERNRAFTEAAMQTVKDIEDGDLSHDGDAALRMHVHNARRRANQWGESLGKVTRDSSNLVDLAVCMVGARMGRRLVLNSGALERAAKTTGKRPGQVVGWS